MGGGGIKKKFSSVLILLSISCRYVDGVEVETDESEYFPAKSKQFQTTDDCYLLKNIKDVFCSFRQVAALTKNNNMILWTDGSIHHDEAMSNDDKLIEIQSKLTNVKTIFQSQCAYAALLENGDVVVWGAGPAGDASAVQSSLKNIATIFTTDFMFAALNYDGQLFTWGCGAGVEDVDKFRDQLKNIQADNVFHNRYAFAVILENGRVVTWGHPNGGGDSSDVAYKLENIITIDIIDSSYYGFTAYTKTGEAITWPDHERRIREQMERSEKWLASMKLQ